MRNGWTEVALGELLKPIDRTEPVEADSSYRLLGVRLEGRGAFHRETKLGSEISAKKLNRVQSGDFIYSRLYAWKGAFSLIGEALDDCCVSNEFPLFRPLRETDLDLRFLRYWFRLSRVWKIVEADCQGSTPTTRNRYNEEFFLRLRVPIPPLEEQQRIVSHLNAIEERSNRIQKLREESERELQILSDNVIDLTIEQWGANHSLGTLDDVVDRIDSGWSPQCESYPAATDTWGILKTTAVQWGKFDPIQNKELPAGYAPRPALAVNKGDVLVTRAGPRKRVGVVALVREKFPQLMISDKVIRLRVKCDFISPEYLELALASSVAQEFLVARKTGLADAQVNISQKILLNTPIPLPNLKIQKQIVEQVHSTRNSISLVQTPQERRTVMLNALLPSILDRVFA